MRAKKRFILIFLFAFAVRLTLVLGTRQYEDRRRFELERVAISLARTSVYGNPYALPTGPTAHVAPGYTVLLAGIFRVFGIGVTGEIVKQVLACAVSSLGYAFVPLAAGAAGMSPAVGTAAALAGAALPFRQTETLGDWEAPFSALLLLLVVIRLAPLWRFAEKTQKPVLMGIQWGITLLFVPAFLTLYLVYLAVTVLFRGGRLRDHLVQITMVAVVLSPWVIRNYWSLGSPVITRTNLGLELRLSNNDQAGPSETRNYNRGVYHLYHPLQNPNEARKILALGEVEYNRHAMHQALLWIQGHFTTFLRLTLGRWREFWFPVTLPFMKAAWLYFTAAGGWIGLYLLSRKDLAGGLLLGIPLLVCPLPHYLVHVNVRHRFPIQWICTLLTVYAIAFAVRNWRSVSVKAAIGGGPEHC